MFAKSFLLYQQKKTQVFIIVHDFYGDQLYGVGHMGGYSNAAGQYGHYAEMPVHGINETLPVLVSIYTIYP